MSPTEVHKLLVFFECALEQLDVLVDRILRRLLECELVELLVFECVEMFGDLVNRLFRHIAIGDKVIFARNDESIAAVFDLSIG